MNETGCRRAACKTGYPFERDMRGSVLKKIDSTTRGGKPSVNIYLLLGARLAIKDNRVHVDIDGTALFKETSAATLKTNLGSGNSRAYVFGTSNRGAIFRNKGNTLRNELEEDAQFRNLNAGQIDAWDTGIDTKGWISCKDLTPGQLIVFEQCRTDTDWRNHAYNLDPAKFSKLWMKEPFLVAPVRAYFVAEAIDRSNWKASNIAAGVSSLPFGSVWRSLVRESAFPYSQVDFGGWENVRPLARTATDSDKAWSQRRRRNLAHCLN